MTAYVIESDVLYPRDAEHRFRLYARRGHELDVLACSSSMEGIGAAIGQLDEDEREYGHGRGLADVGAIGILDAVDRRWVVLPWHRQDAPALREQGREWVGKTVRVSGPRTEQLWRVDRVVPLGYHLLPLGDDGEPLSSQPGGPRPLTRTLRQLEYRWEIVPDPKGDR